MSGVEDSRDPRLVMEGLYLRFNPANVEVSVNCLYGETVIGGILHLRGFTQETGIVDRCTIILDVDVEPGHVIVERMPPFSS